MLIMTGGSTEVNLIHNLKEIVWALNKGDSVADESNTASIIEEAIDEIEHLRDEKFDEDRILEEVVYWSNEDIRELEEKLKKHRLWEVNRFDNDEVTVDMLAEQVIEWYDMSVKELKSLAKNKKLKVSGTKQDLVSRLKDNYLDEHQIVL